MKKIILVVVLLLLCGCSVEYNVNIGSDIEETVIIDDNITVQTPAFINDQGSSETNEIIDGIKYYELQNNQTNTVYKYNFSFSNYAQSTAVNTCLKSMKLSNSDNKYILTTTNHFTCMDYYPKIDDITVNLTITDTYNIISHNADVANNNILTWNINRNNYKDKNIQLIFSKKEGVGNNGNPGSGDNSGQVNEKDNKNSIILAFMVLIGFIAVLGLLIMYKLKKNQRV